MKYCTKCGAPIEENDSYCKSCGSSQTKINTYEFTDDAEAFQFNYTKYITLSILSIIFSNLISGILALVFTMTANDALKSGDYSKAKTNQGYAKVCLIISLVLVCLTAALVIFTMILFFIGMSTMSFAL